MRFCYSYILRPIHTATFALDAILLSACGSQPTDPLDEALEKAGKNRAELESVLEHYRTANIDSQKLAAAEFLIANIDSAFSRWRLTPWQGRYTFEDFCEWVLPYRIRNESPHEHWRAGWLGCALSIISRGYPSPMRKPEKEAAQHFATWAADC